MATAEPPIVKRSLFSWIFAGNVKLQLLLDFYLLAAIVVIIAASLYRMDFFPCESLISVTLTLSYFLIEFWMLFVGAPVTVSIHVW